MGIVNNITRQVIAASRGGAQEKSSNPLCNLLGVDKLSWHTQKYLEAQDLATVELWTKELQQIGISGSLLSKHFGRINRLKPHFSSIISQMKSSSDLRDEEIEDHLSSILKFADTDEETLEVITYLNDGVRKDFKMEELIGNLGFLDSAARTPMRFELLMKLARKFLEHDLPPVFGFALWSTQKNPSTRFIEKAGEVFFEVAQEFSSHGISAEMHYVFWDNKLYDIYRSESLKEYKRAVEEQLRLCLLVQEKGLNLEAFLDEYNGLLKVEI